MLVDCMVGDGDTPLWTETPSGRTPPQEAETSSGGRPPLDIDTPGQGIPEETWDQTGSDIIPPVNRMTDTCENITFPQLHWRPVKIFTIDI